MTGHPRHTQIAAALIRRGENVLLVQQQGPDDPEPLWALRGIPAAHPTIYTFGLQSEQYG